MLEKAIFFFVFVVLCICVLVYIFVVDDLNLAGSEVTQLQDHIRQVRKENQEIQQEIYLQASYTMIASISAKMGFIPSTNKSYIYLK